MELTKEELEKLQAFNSDRVDLKLEIAKHEVDKLSAYSRLSKLENAFAPVQNAMIEKYGTDSRIDIQTGIVTKK